MTGYSGTLEDEPMNQSFADVDSSEEHEDYLFTVQKIIGVL
jgi:hypothetical protein